MGNVTVSNLIYDLQKCSLVSSSMDGQVYVKF